MARRTLTIKRVNGNIDIVDVSKDFYRLNDVIVSKIRMATARAGGGIVIDWENEEDEYEMGLDRAKKVVAKYEAGNCCKSKESAKKWHSLQNEGGEGYMPEIITKKEYDLAVATINKNNLK